MIYVSASSKGRRLRLKKGKEYALYFPKKNAIISVQQVSTFKGGIALNKFKNASLAQLDYELNELVQ